MPIDKLRTPHGNFIDMRDPAKPVLLIADRSNNRIVRYTLDDKPIDVIGGTRSPCYFHSYKGTVVVPDLHPRVTLFDKDNKVIIALGRRARPVNPTEFGLPRIALILSLANSSLHTERYSITPAISSLSSLWKSAGSRSFGSLRDFAVICS